MALKDFLRAQTEPAPGASAKAREMAQMSQRNTGTTSPYAQYLTRNQTAVNPYMQYLTRNPGQGNPYAKYLQNPSTTRTPDTTAMDEFWKASGYDLLRRDISNMNTRMRDYFENSHTAGSFSSAQDNAEKVLSMIQAIEREEKFFQTYASQVPPQTLAAVQQEMAGWKQELSQMQSALLSARDMGEGGTYQGKTATTATAALMGSGFQSLAKDMQAHLNQSQQLQHGQIITGTGGNAASAKQLLERIGQTRNYLERNGAPLLAARDEIGIGLEDMREMLDQWEAQLQHRKGIEAGALVNPITGRSVPTVRQVTEEGIQETGLDARERRRQGELLSEALANELVQTEDLAGTNYAKLSARLQEAVQGAKQKSGTSNSPMGSVQLDRESALLAQVLQGADEKYYEIAVKPYAELYKGGKTAGQSLDEKLEATQGAYDAYGALDEAQGEMQRQMQNILAMTAPVLELAALANAMQRDINAGGVPSEETMKLLRQYDLSLYNRLVTATTEYQTAERKAKDAQNSAADYDREISSMMIQWMQDVTEREDYEKLSQVNNDKAQNVRMQELDSEDPEYVVSDPVDLMYAIANHTEGWEYLYNKAGQELLDGTEVEILPNAAAYMTEDELGMFNYLYNSGDKKGALDFVRLIAPNLIQRQGAEMAEKMDVPVVRQLYSVFSGVRNWGRSMRQLFRDTPVEEGADEAAIQELMLRNQDNDLARITMSAGQSIGQMAPALTTGYLLGPLGGAASTAGASAMTFFSTKGGAYTEGLREGMTPQQASQYSTMVGAAEAGLGSVLSGVGGVTGGWLSKTILKRLGTGAQTALKAGFKKWAVNLAGELVEENIQNYLEPAFKMMVGAAEEYDAPSLQDFIDTSLSVAISTSLLGAGETLAPRNAVNQYREELKSLSEEYAQLSKREGMEGLAAYAAELEAIAAGKLKIESTEEGYALSKDIADQVQRVMEEAARYVNNATIDQKINSMETGVLGDMKWGTLDEEHAMEHVANVEAAWQALKTREDLSHDAVAAAARLAQQVGYITVHNARQKNLITSEQHDEAQRRLGEIVREAKALLGWEEVPTQKAAETQNTASQAVVEEAPREVSTEFSFQTPLETVGTLTAAHNLTEEDINELYAVGEVSQKRLEELSESGKEDTGFSVVVSSRSPQSGIESLKQMTVVMPSTVTDMMRLRLNSLGVPTVEYEAGNQQARAEAINGLEGVREAQENEQKIQREIDRRADEVVKANEALVGASEFGLVDNGGVKNKEIKNLLNVLGKAARVKILVTDMESADLSGWYQDGVVYINKKAKNPITVIAQHEITHRLREAAPEAYREFEAYALAAISKRAKKSTAELVIDKQEQYRKNGIELSNEEAMEELAADFAGELLVDVKQFERYAKQNRETAGKILTALRNFIEKLRRYFQEGSRDKREYQAKKQFSLDYETVETALAKWEAALASVDEKQTGEGKRKFTFLGHDDATRKPIYESNFPLGTPRSEKAQRILWYIQNVWSKKPIPLKIKNPDGSTRIIEAKFDPTYSEDKSVKTDASKLMGGNRHGTAREQRVTLDLADDYYQIVRESEYNRSKNETGKDSETHKDVKQWHYFIDDILFQEQGSQERESYRVTINIKEKDDGSFVYSFNAERPEETKKEELSTRQTLHADVNQTEKNGEVNAQLFEFSVAENVPGVNRKFLVDGDGTETKGNKEEFLPEGESPYRTVQVPAETEHGKTSLTARTIMEAQATPDSAVEALQQEVREGGFSYVPITDKNAKAQAALRVEQDGYEKTLADWLGNTGQLTKNEVATGWVLYNNAVNAGNTKLAVEIATEIAARVRSSAQSVQAVRILKQLSPEYQLYSMEKAVQRLQRELDERYGWTELAPGYVTDQYGLPVEEGTETKPKSNNAEASSASEAQQPTTSGTAETVTGTEEVSKAAAAVDKVISSAGEDAEVEIKVSRGKGKQRIVLELDEDLVNEFLKTKNEAKRERIKKQIYKDIASQVPSTWVDKFNAWRYLAMLLNPRTHVRNIVGNAGFVPVRAIKNTLATTMQLALKQEKRTSAFLNMRSESDKELLRFAKEDYHEVEDIIQSGGKYDKTAEKEITKEQQVFETKVLEAVRRFNTKAMDREDTWFSKPAYARSLARYLKAKRISAEAIRNKTVSEDTMDAARAHAILEAQKATYRDTNAFSEAISNIGKKQRKTKAGNVAEKTIGTLVEGVLPFKKTPANIIVRGVEYSPLNLLRLPKQFYDARKGKNGRTMADVLDTAATGLTGTALLFLGAWLAKMGILHGVEDDEEKRAFYGLQGKQNYSITIGGMSFTIDFLAPEALPVFIGAEIVEALDNDGDLTGKEISEMLMNISEPMLELSMLSSLNDLLDEISYSDNKLMTILSSAATNYLTQYVPSLLGSIERITEDRRYSTYADKDHAWLMEDMQYLLANLANRVPGGDALDYRQIPYVDAWGREEETGNVLLRIVANLGSPSYWSSDTSTPMDEELLRLYDEGYESVLPERLKHSTQIGDRYLTAEEYLAFAKAMGKERLDLYEAVIGADWYQELTDYEKSQVVAYAEEYSKAVGKLAAGNLTEKMIDALASDTSASAAEILSEIQDSTWYDRLDKEEKESADRYINGGDLEGLLALLKTEYIFAPDGWVARAMGGEAAGVSPELYIHAKIATDEITGIKKENGDTVTNSGSLLKMQALYDIEMTDEQRQYLFAAIGIGETVVGYTEEEVDRIVSSGAFEGGLKMLEQAESYGLEYQVYLDLKDQIKDVTSEKDKKTGEPVPGSKKKKVLQIIQKLEISIREKDALYLMLGYSKSTIDEAPWH